MQQGMLFHGLEDAGSGLYVNQLSVEIGGLDAARLRSAWQAVSDRHAVLRTGMLWEGLPGVAQQVVHRRVAVPFVEEDWRGRPADAAGLQAAAAAERAKGFDLAQPPLQRVRLIRLAGDRHQLIWTRHHILTDGWSSARLVAEILAAYRGAPPSPAAAPYRDYIAWLQTRDQAASQVFWRDQIRLLDGPTLLASALPAPAGGQGHAQLRTRLDPALATQLQDFAAAERVTLNTLIQGAWALLLRHHTGQATVCFGATVAGRPAELPGIEATIGLFINTLPIATTVPPAAKLGDWLRGLQAQNAAMREHEHTPLYEIQAWAGHAGRPLFDSIVVFENYPVELALESEGGPAFGPVAHDVATHYPLTLAVFRTAHLDLDLGYDTARFGAAAIVGLRDALLRLLERMPDGADQALGSLPSLAAAERTALLRWGVGTPAAASHTDVVAAIAARAAAQPDAIALVHGGAAMTYGALNARANRLAHHLRSLGVGPEVVVGLAVERSAAQIVAMLAVLKAGGAYLPLDPAYPAGRLAQMMRDSRLALVLTQEALLDTLPDAGARRWCLDRDWQDAEAWPETAPAVAINSKNIAYLITTSGSTGLPKAVAVPHGPLAMHCAAIARLYGMGPQDRELQFASINFDIAHERWLVALMAGASISLGLGADPSMEALAGLIETQSITSLFLPPAYADQLSAALLARGESLSLRACILGGDAWPTAGIAAVRRALRPTLLVNAYGPTETVIAPLAWPVAGDEIGTAYAPIGRPVGARTAYVLDAALNLVPPGVAGELHIGGDGLARGYHARPGLTAARFIPDPFGAEPGGRLYRTGDLVRWHPDGVVEYLGRVDRQVKIRGFRIEPGEIEARLREQPGVAEAVVVARDAAAGRQLIGYVTGAAEGPALRTALAAVLPDHMVPAQVVVLDRLPLTPNGKIDRHALPEPERQVRACVAPRNATEQALAAIWAELLGLDAVGVTEDFFELGGHSLTVMRMASLIRDRLDRVLPLRAIFEHPTIEQLACRVADAAPAGIDAAAAAKIDAILASLEAVPE
jgi:amino acid adenylation domain-containing protein